jgi:light-regulated signal transduction histidine kinase (bacteriophytochrome)
MVVRTLRHEVGDLLQSIYSAVTILQERLSPEQTLERGILTNLRARAETCKDELDAAHDLIIPLQLNFDWVDLAELTGSIVASCSLRHPDLSFVCETARPLTIWADAPRLAHAGTLLVMTLCPMAQKKVVVSAQSPAESDSAEWSFSHDGPTSNADRMIWLTSPFSTTRQARRGLSLALARRVIELHGGSVRTEQPPQASFRVVLTLPRGQPSS